MRIVVLRGKEQFLIEERTRRFADTLREAYGEIDRFSFDGATVSLADVLDELRSYGLMHSHKLVILDRADQFLAREGHRAAMERYAEQPVEESTLLMRAETWRPGKVDKLIEKIGAIVKCEPITDAKAKNWCGSRCEKRYDCRIASDAADLLVAQIGPDLARLDAELAKLAAYVGIGETIDRAAVGEMVGLSREEQAWAIQSAIAAGDPRDALLKLRELLGVSRLPETLVTWAITDLLRKLHTASQALRAGEAPGAIAKQLRLWGESQRLILDAARRHPPELFARLLDQAIRSDVHAKRGVGVPARTLEALTVLVADTL
jgi:DNA polymerase-3 subunit delta